MMTERNGGCTIGWSPRTAEDFLLIAESHIPGLPQGDRLRDFLKELEALPHSQHPPIIVVAYAVGFSAVFRFPWALLHHEPNYSVREKTAILKERKKALAEQLGVDPIAILPVKTVTLRAELKGNPSYFLFTRLGDLPIDHQVKKDLAPAVQRLLETEINVLSRATINPPEFDPADCLGIDRGMVNPFVKPNQSLRALLYYYDPSRNCSYDFAAIAVSPEGTLVVGRPVFNATLNWWQETHATIPCRVVCRSMRD